MNKNQAINFVNSKRIGVFLDSKNTHWSNIVKYSKDFGWWLNIPFSKFKSDLFLILNDSPNKHLILIKIPANTILSPENKFRNKENTADIFISYNDKQNLTDIQSNSTYFKFADYFVAEIPWV